MNPGMTEEAGKVASGAVEAMKSTPLAIALLLVNMMFLGFSGFILHDVSDNARYMDKTQMELIAKLVMDCRK